MTLFSLVAFSGACSAFVELPLLAGDGLVASAEGGRRSLLHLDGGHFRAMVFVGQREITDIPLRVTDARSKVF